VISEFRFRGPNGANDEFVEIYNNTDTDHTVASSDGSSGYALIASDGVIRFVIPNGTVIPARGHYLGVNSVAYSLASYPAGNGNTATGDATFTTDIPDNNGVALFNTSNVANFTLANRFDAAGSTSVVPPPVSATVVALDVIGLRSAVPEGWGNVVRLITRKRRLVMFAPVLLVNLRRIESLPNVALFGGSLVKSRPMFGATLSPCNGSIAECVMVAPVSLALERFSGPGAPRRWPAPALTPFVSTKMKSAALSSLSTGKPAPLPEVGTRRTKL
jgi:hypothetical protein